MIISLDNLAQIMQKHKKLLEHDDNAIATFEILGEELLRFDIKDSQIDKPYLKIWEKEKVMSIHCNDELWKFINKLESLDEENFTIGKMGKIYFELKKLIGKGFIREGKTIRE